MRKKRKRQIRALLLVVLLILPAGCGTHAGTDTEALQEESGRSGIVSVPIDLTFFFADGDTNGRWVMSEMANRFNEQYEDITITVVPGTGNNYDEMLKTLESVGEFPDILETQNAASYVRAELLAPLSEDIRELFTETVLIDGEVYTAPIANNNTFGIIYNKTYFEENGLSEPETYEEFLQLCGQIQSLGDMSPMVVGGQDLWHLGFWFSKTYNDQVLSQDMDFIVHCYDGTTDFTAPSFAAALEELLEIFQYAQEGWASTPDAQIVTCLVNGAAAMTYTGHHILATIASASPDFEVGWFAVPSPDGSLWLTGGSSSEGLAISTEAASDPDKKAAAEEFIRFFFEEENYSWYCEELNVVNTSLKNWNRETDGLSQEMVEALVSADYVVAQWNNETGEKELPADFRNYTYKVLTEFLQGEISVQEACEKINDTWMVSIQSFNPVTGVGLD